MELHVHILITNFCFFLVFQRNKLHSILTKSKAVVKETKKHKRMVLDQMNINATCNAF